MKYVSNAFSLQMLDKEGALVRVGTVSSFPNDAKSIIGHEDTARVLGVDCNRENVTLKEGDILYVAQLTGGQLPEGCKELPEGFKFKFFKVRVSYK